MAPTLTPDGSRRFSLPSWGVNLAGFGALIALVLAVFFWQLIAMDQDLPAIP